MRKIRFENILMTLVLLTPIINFLFEYFILKIEPGVVKILASIFCAALLVIFFIKKREYR